jgi:hypothetical protein
MFLDPINRLAPGAQAAGNHHVGFGADPARQHAPDDYRIVNDHDPYRLLDRNGRRRGSEDDTHALTLSDNALTHSDIHRFNARRADASV